MSSTGQIIVRTYMSQMTIPITNAQVFVYRMGKENQTELVALRMTDVNGETEAIIIDTPDESESQSIDETQSGEPFSVVNIFIEAPGFESVLIHDAQVFSNNVTLQNAEMVPLAQPQIRENDRVEDVFVTPQPLSGGFNQSKGGDENA